MPRRRRPACTSSIRNSFAKRKSAGSTGFAFRSTPRAGPTCRDYKLSPRRTLVSTGRFAEPSWLGVRRSHQARGHSSTRFFLWSSHPALTLCKTALDHERIPLCAPWLHLSCEWKCTEQAPNKRSKLAGGDGPRGSGALCADAHELSFNNGCAGGRVARSLSAMRYASIAPETREVRVFGSSAVGTGRSAMRVESGAQAHAFRIRYLAVYRRGARGWELIAWQSTRLPT